MNKVQAPVSPLVLMLGLVIGFGASSGAGFAAPTPPSIGVPKVATNAPPPTNAAPAIVEPTAAEKLLELFKKEDNVTNTLGAVLVWIPAGFRVGQYEVTQAEFQEVMGENPSKFEGARRPVERVTWSAAAEFCRRLTELEHKAEKLPKNFTYQLPSEADFDLYVADTPLDTAIVSLIGDRRWTEEVGLRGPNKLGLYDVRGNVWEWTSSPVARGSSYQSHEDYLSTTFRFAGSAETRYEDVGFRIVLKDAAGS